MQTFVVQLLLLSSTQMSNTVQMSCRNLQDEFENYEASVKRLGEESHQVAPPPGGAPPAPGGEGAMCEICRKTKFADGVGHQCHYCAVKACARCGGAHDASRQQGRILLKQSILFGFFF